jgi:hypothetical protein
VKETRTTRIEEEKASTAARPDSVCEARYGRLVQLLSPVVCPACVCVCTASEAGLQLIGNCVVVQGVSVRATLRAGWAVSLTFLK